jgi:putative ABC transport system permease protein
MTIFKLVRKEIIHRKFSFIIGVLSIAIAAGVLSAEFTILRKHDIRTEKILIEKEKQLKKDMKKLEDDYRKIMKKLGFNLLILPEKQELGDFYANGYAAKTMPENYVEKLSHSGIMTIRHLLPCLEQKIRWKEQGNRLVIINGIRGEIPFSHRSPKEPMIIAVPQGKLAAGYEIWSSLGLKAGDTLHILGKKFVLGSCHPQRGNRDDVTVWIDLDEAQELLNKEGQINAILALKCHCSGSEIEKVRTDIHRILPGTNIIEISEKVLVRAKARERARKAAVRALLEEKKSRGQIRGELENFASWLIPFVIIGCVAWTAFLSFANTRERRGEIAILSAIGFSCGQLLTIVLSRAFIMGCLGAIVGYFAGTIIGISSGEIASNESCLKLVFSGKLLPIVLLSTPAISILSCIVPALSAALKSPADVFSKE